MTVFSQQQVIAHNRAVIADSRVNIEVMTGVEAHPTAGHGEKDFGYQVNSPLCTSTVQPRHSSWF